MEPEARPRYLVSAFHGALVVVVALCAVPGLLFMLGRVVEWQSTRPFTDNNTQDLWTMVHLANFFVIQFTSPVVVPLMWGAFFFRRPSLSPAARRVLLAVAGAGTLGVLLFWILPV